MREPNQAQVTAVKMGHLQITTTKLITWAQVHDSNRLVIYPNPPPPSPPPPHPPLTPTALQAGLKYLRHPY